MTNNQQPQPQWYLSERDFRPRELTDADRATNLPAWLKINSNLFGDLADANRASAAVRAALEKIAAREMTDFDCVLIQKAQQLRRGDYALIGQLTLLADSSEARTALDNIAWMMRESFLETDE